MVRRFVHFGVLVIEEYRYGEKTFHLNVNLFPVGKSTDSISKFVFKEFSYGEKSPGRAKDICKHKGCQLKGTVS
jgi:hypothetical protein